jgi:hypothetical protein
MVLAEAIKQLPTVQSLSGARMLSTVQETE